MVAPVSNDELTRFASRHGLEPEAERELRQMLDASRAAALSPVPTGGWVSSGHSLGADTINLDSIAHESASAAPEPLPRPRSGSRYQDLGPIGMGGMAEVRRVYDRDLDRTLAMKIIRTELMVKRSAVARFMEEARITAKLQHPGIVPVHDIGQLDDGRYYFTMKEVLGRTLRETIRMVHSSGGQPSDGVWTFRRVVDSFLTVCEAVAFAHQQAVVHRDLKPSNVMVGDFGQTLVMDWGLAKALGAPELEEPPSEEQEPLAPRSWSGAPSTQLGAVVGTPAYMPPEQARGELDQVGPHSDVYSLGAILYEILFGKEPFVGSNESILRDLLSVGPSFPHRQSSRAPIKPSPFAAAELVELCERAMSMDPSSRPANAGLFAAEISAWLDGARKRDQAVTLVAEARAMAPRVNELRQRARTLRADAQAKLKDIKGWEPVSKKLPIWEIEDEADHLERTATVQEVEYTERLRLALTHAPGLDEANALLADTWRAAHEAAERQRDIEQIARTEAMVRAHDTGKYAHYLRGVGALTLHTAPEEVQTELFRYEIEERRMVMRPVRSLGSTPLDAVELPMGSYLVLLTEPGYRPVRYPVLIRRQEHVHGSPPGARSTLPIRLPTHDELPDGVEYVPPGWFSCGGDDHAFSALPLRRVWLDGFAMMRFPVTFGWWLRFLDELARDGREEEALLHAPRELGKYPGDLGPLLLDRRKDGRFMLKPETRWSADMPVHMIPWESAWAYAAWYSKRTGIHWRLPSEVEWEKAARGVDGRFFPWGDFLDPTWTNMARSHQSALAPSVVDTYPVDESPYGVRGLGGNIRDWCQDAWSDDGPIIVNQRLIVSQERPEPSALHVLRGGYWDGSERDARASSRFRFRPVHRAASVGFRLVFSWPNPKAP